MATSSASAPTVVTGEDVLHASLSDCGGHDTLERRSNKSRLSKQNEVEMNEDTSVTAIELCDTLSAKATEAIGMSVDSQNTSQNGIAVCCKIVTTDAAEAEVPELKEALTSNDSFEYDMSADAEDIYPDYDMQALNLKVKLERCQAVYDDASPPPELASRTPVVITESSDGGFFPTIPPSASQSSLTISPTLQAKHHDRLKLGQSSSQGSTVSDGGPSPAMSRDSSIDAAYTDSTGTNLEEFIIKTLNKNRNDRSMLMRLEADMIAFVNDTNKEKWKFPPMTSYHRMLVHRVAAFFGLDHNIDELGKCVIVNRLQTTRIPDFKFREHIYDDMPASSDAQPKKSILKRHRDCTSLEENLGVDRTLLDERKSKSFEERTEEYREARSRIFKEDPEFGDGKDELSPRDCVESGGDGGDQQVMMMHWSTDGQQWRSADSSGYSTDTSSQLRFSVANTSSFPGITVLSRGDSQTSSLSSGSRFSKTDSCSSGILNAGSPIFIPPMIPCSPTQEGQSNETVNTTSVNQSIVSSCNPHHWHAGGDGPSAGSPFLPFMDESGEPLAIWVASTISQIPPGSIIINPKKGEPYINPDGTIYRWFPPPHNVSSKEHPGTEDTSSEAETLVGGTDEMHPSTSLYSADRMLPEMTTLPSFASTCTSSKSTVTVPVMVKGHSVSHSRATTKHAVLMVSSASSASTSMTHLPQNISSFPGPVSAQPNQQLHVSNRHSVPPPVPPLYGGHSSISNSYCPAPMSGNVRFVCPQGIGYPAAPGPLEQPSPAGDASSHYGYLTTYPADTLQVMTYPFVGMQPTDGYQQQTQQPHGYSQQVVPQPLTLVPQYPDQTWNQFQQPMTLVQGRGSVGGPMYYAIDPVAGTQATAVPGPVGQCPVQLIMVSSASNLTPSHGQPVVYAGPPPNPILPATSHSAYVGSGTSSSGQPQYVQYTYHSGGSQQSLQGTVPMMPFFPNMMSLPVPAVSMGATPRGSTPCLVPVVRPPVPSTSSRLVTCQSPSPKSVQITTPLLPSGMSLLRMPPRDHPVRPQGPDQKRSINRPSGRPALTPRQPRFGAVHPAQNNVAFHPPMIVNAGDSRCPRGTLQRMVHGSPLPSTFLQKPRASVGSFSDGSSVLVSSDVRKSVATQPLVGPSAEVTSAILEVCGVPPGLSRQKLNSYLADLTACGAKEFRFHDNSENRSKDATGAGGSTSVVAVFDSVTSAQKALRSHRGKGYQLQATSQTYDLNHRS